MTNSNHYAPLVADSVSAGFPSPAEQYIATSVGEVWGVGRKLSPKLEALGIHNAWQLAMADGGFLRTNEQFGKGAVFNLAEGIKKPWAMKREYLSQSFTTNWEQILKVK